MEFQNKTILVFGAAGQQGGSVAIGRVPHEQASADTANAGKPGPGPGGPERRNDGVASVRRRRTHLRASTDLQGENGAGDRCTAGPLDGLVSHRSTRRAFQF